MRDVCVFIEGEEEYIVSIALRSDIKYASLIMLLD